MTEADALISSIRNIKPRSIVFVRFLIKIIFQHVW